MSHPRTLPLALALAALAGCRAGTLDAPEPALHLTPATATAAPGDTVHLRATCTDPRGRPTPCGPVRWRLSGPGTLLAADGAARLTLAAPGRALVTAETRGLRQRAAVVVPDSMAAPNVLVDTTQTHQAISGWEATIAGGWDAPDWAYDTLALWAADTLGLTRLRLEITGNAIETRVPASRGCLLDSGEWIGQNDDASPSTTDPGGFRWDCLDRQVERVVLPVRRRVEAMGRRFTLNVCYVGFRPTSAFQQDDPAEYAELVVQVIRHLRDRYALVPDRWEVRLEPDAGDVRIDGTRLGQLMVAADSALRANGLPPVAFTAPSTLDPNKAARYARAILAVPGAAPLLRELSYHRYRPPLPGTLAGLAHLADSLGIPTAQLEYLKGGIDEAFTDLMVPGVSAWSRYALAAPNPDPGAGIQLFADTVAERFKPRPEPRRLAQLFRAVPPGAVRVGATAQDGLRALAFRLPSGGVALVLATGAAATARVAGLPPGRYRVSLSVEGTPAATGGPLVVGPAGRLTVAAPAAGVLAIVPSP